MNDSEEKSIVVREVGKYSFADIRKALFPEGRPEPRTLQELAKGSEEYIRAKHARCKHGRAGTARHGRFYGAK